MGAACGCASAAPATVPGAETQNPQAAGSKPVQQVAALEAKKEESKAESTSSSATSDATPKQEAPAETKPVETKPAEPVEQQAPAPFSLKRTLTLAPGEVEAAAEEDGSTKEEPAPALKEDPAPAPKEEPAPAPKEEPAPAPKEEPLRMEPAKKQASATEMAQRIKLAEQVAATYATAPASKSNKLAKPNSTEPAISADTLRASMTKAKMEAELKDAQTIQRKQDEKAALHAKQAEDITKAKQNAAKRMEEKRAGRKVEPAPAPTVAPAREERLREAFVAMDKNSNGVVDLREFLAGAKAGDDKVELSMMFSFLDDQEATDKKISMEEWLAGMALIGGSEEAFNQEMDELMATLKAAPAAEEAAPAPAAEESAPAPAAEEAAPAAEEAAPAAEEAAPAPAAEEAAPAAEEAAPAAEEAAPAPAAEEAAPAAEEAAPAPAAEDATPAPAAEEAAPAAEEAAPAPAAEEAAPAPAAEEAAPAPAAEEAAPAVEEAAPAPAAEEAAPAVEEAAPAAGEAAPAAEEAAPAAEEAAPAVEEAAPAPAAEEAAPACAEAAPAAE